MRSQLRAVAKATNESLRAVGIDGRTTIAAARAIRATRAERREYERQRVSSETPNDFPILRSYPMFVDRFEAAGTASGHYFHQDLLVAREIFERNPARHVDVGSAIYGFVSHVASFREIEVMDVRPIGASVSGMRFIQQDVMHLDSSFCDYADSVSCLHALEHFGLGRYTDSIDYDGWRRGLRSLTNMVKSQGVLYLGVPTGEPQRVEFNAHRVFSLPFLREVLERDFSIERLAFIDDSGDLAPSVDPHSRDANRSFGAKYGCSVWVLKKM
jgi:hypothetical protein